MLVGHWLSRIGRWYCQVSGGAKNHGTVETSTDFFVENSGACIGWWWSYTKPKGAQQLCVKCKRHVFSNEHQDSRQYAYHVI